MRHRSSNCHLPSDELTTKSRAFSSKMSAAASLPRSSHWRRSRHTRRSTQPSAAVANMEKATVEIDSLAHLLCCFRKIRSSNKDSSVQLSTTEIHLFAFSEKNERLEPFQILFL